LTLSAPVAAGALFVRAFADMTEYRAEITIWMISGSLPLVMMAVWIGLAGSGPIGGYSADGFVAYFLLVFLVRQFTVVWVVWELDRQIRLGELSSKLLRPIHPLWGHLADTLAEKVVRLPLVALPVGLGMLAAGVRVPFSFDTLATALLLVGGALLLSTIAILDAVWFAFTTTAFWFVKVDNVSELFSAFFAAGRFPISAYPGWVRVLLAFLVPVAFLTTVPAEAASGLLAWPWALGLLGMAGLLLGLSQCLWRTALASYTSASS
jgi:ABC-2 type transport system permease protein